MKWLQALAQGIRASAEDMVRCIDSCLDAWTDGLFAVSF